MLEENGENGHTVRTAYSRIFGSLSWKWGKIRSDLKVLQQYGSLHSWFSARFLCVLFPLSSHSIFNKIRCFQQSQLKIFRFFDWYIPAWIFFFSWRFASARHPRVLILWLPKTTQGKRCFPWNSHMLQWTGNVSLKMPLRSVSATDYELIKS